MEQDIDVRSIVGLLRRQAWVVTSVVLIFLVMTAIIVYSITPKYTATTKIIVDVAAKDLLDPNEQTVYSSNDINARVESEVEILQSDNAILKVINDQNLLADEEFGVSVGLLDQVREFLNLANPRQSSGTSCLRRLCRRSALRPASAAVT